MSPSGPLALRLSDGTRIELRPVTPGDAARLAAGFEELSLDSRTQRFLAPVTHLSPEQLRYFTEVDHVDHVAWGAVDPERRGEPGLGIGRWVRLSGEDHVAEFSLTVVDDAQGRGLGTTLLAVLFLAAEARDVRVLRGVVSRTNHRMVQWMQRLGAAPAPDDVPDDGVISLDLQVSTDPASFPDTAPARELAKAIGRVRAAAEGGGRWRRRSRRE